MSEGKVESVPAIIRGEGLILRADGTVKAKFFLTGETDLTPEKLREMTGIDVKIEERE